MIVILLDVHRVYYISADVTKHDLRKIVEIMFCMELQPHILGNFWAIFISFSYLSGYATISMGQLLKMIKI